MEGEKDVLQVVVERDSHTRIHNSQDRRKGRDASSSPNRAKSLTRFLPCSCNLIRCMPLLADTAILPLAASSPHAVPATPATASPHDRTPVNRPGFTLILNPLACQVDPLTHSRQPVLTGYNDGRFSSTRLQQPYTLIDIVA